jgi:NAD-dependent deacetylase
VKTRTEIERAAQTILASRYVIALVGAGISVESGIPPFRGKGGLWTKHGEPPMDGYQRFLADPAEHWRQMLERRATDDEFSRALRDARPNAAHVALARLESIGVLRHTISQNIDNLHFEAGSLAVTEIHGNRTKVRCIDCGARWTWTEFLAAHPELADGADEAPVCPQCGGIVKGDTVMFGEQIPRAFLDECQSQAEAADCIIIAGTSASVTPAAYFPEMVLRAGGAVIEVNTEETPFTPYASATLRGPAGELLPALVAAVEALLETDRTHPQPVQSAKSVEGNPR